MSHMSVAVNMTARPGRRTFFLPGLFFIGMLMFSLWSSTVE